jgi:cytochrome c oxidase subunit IV
MSNQVQENRWWRYVPKSERAGWLYVVAWSFVIVVSAVSLVVDHFNGTLSVLLQVLILVLGVWNLIRSVTGLAALNRR